MPNNKKFVVKNGLQTQNIDFVSNNESNTIVVSINDSNVLSVEGNVAISGSLYDSNNLSGTFGQILTSTQSGISWTSVQGVSGLSGYSGYSGISGYSGSAGSTGVSGFSGYSGSAGAAGTSGFSGYSGKDPIALRKTENYTAVAGEILIADTSSGSFTITLPNSPSVGNKVRIYDSGNWANNSLTVARNGSTIEGYNDDFVLDIGQIYVDFVYDGTTWHIFGSIGKSGYSGYSGTSAQAISFDGGTPEQDYSNGPGFDAGSVT